MNECKWTEDFEGNWETWSCNRSRGTSRASPTKYGSGYLRGCFSSIRKKKSRNRPNARTRGKNVAGYHATERRPAFKEKSAFFVPADGSSQGYFTTERRCPECERRMVSDGRGMFRCPGCQYRDRQDVSRLYAAGLDYPFWAPGERIEYGRWQKTARRSK